MAYQMASWLLVVFSGAIAAAAYFFIILLQHRRSFQGFPKPPHDWFWGHLKLFGEIMAIFPNNNHYQAAITTISQRYDLPGLWYLDLWPFAPDQLIITDPDLALHVTVLKNHPKHYMESKFMNPIIGDGNIATAEGPVWKAAHNTLAPAFSVTHVRNMIGMIAEEVMVFRSILQDLANSGEVFSLEDKLQNLIFDTIGKATFETSPNAQKKDNVLLQHFSDMCAENVIVQSSFNPIRLFLARRRMQSIARKMDAALEIMTRDRYDQVRRESVDMSKKRGLCIMDLVLREHLDEVQKTGKDALDATFMRTAATHVKTLLLAGSGTTTSTLCFAYMLLSIHPEIVRRLREEHDSVFAAGIEATYTVLQEDPQRLNRLDFTTNVVKEVLRLYPIGNTARSEDATGFITYQGKQYPTKGMLIAPVQNTMHWNPNIFPNASKFDPDRFSRDETPRTAWRPFERGPRACLGQTLAMEEMKVVLLLTIRDFDFTCANLKPNKTPRVPWTDLDVYFGDRAFQEFRFEAKPRDGMPMMVRRSGWA